MTMRSCSPLLLAAAALVVSIIISCCSSNVSGFVALSSSSSSSSYQRSDQYATTTVPMMMKNTVNDNNDDIDSAQEFSRRGFFTKAAAAVSASAVITAAMTVAQPVLAAQEPELRQGIKVDPFNGLAFNYRGGDFGGLDSSEVNEPSITYADFNDKLKSGQVAFVEFLAPDGDVAYATIKQQDGESGNNISSSTGKKLRIGEGYPTEQHDGYSSPMFCVRAVKNAGVSYKFVVPALIQKSSS
eukprot:CAMPEP_0113457652 /NCGR_PEP_ID=MMETSP0014_2-20120614/9519_1 /TAXON_ID=2857 /ORGANISM="Nitzschia sp." /LENGTH=241 /DNA_ID=CAMNT_0000349155 /DNA_START=15 /DNA_END=743 /DNA_ORIENTATION=+ /assembly_acc=CAM_ASM_000159